MMIKLIIALGCVGYAGASECCNGYYNLLNNWVDPQWCENYCCGSTLIPVGLYCCDNVLLEAVSDDRSDFCILWWQHNIWAPIVSAVVGLLIILACCWCCYKCCCSSNRTTIIYQNPTPGATFNSTVVSSQTSMNSNYNQPVHFDPIKY